VFAQRDHRLVEHIELGRRAGGREGSFEVGCHMPHMEAQEDSSTSLNERQIMRIIASLRRK
jgi:hypothetical protein